MTTINKPTLTCWMECENCTSGHWQKEPTQECPTCQSPHYYDACRQCGTLLEKRCEHPQAFMTVKDYEDYLLKHSPRHEEQDENVEPMATG